MFRALIPNILQTGSLMITGDLIAQTLVEKKTLFEDNQHSESVDWKRTARFATFGFCIAGPALATWYRVLNRFVGTSGTRVVLTKVAIDQSVFAPTFILIFLSSQNLLQGKSVRETKEDVYEKFPHIISTNYKIWPWVQLTNFYFVPLKYQVLYVQTFAVFWNTYLSWKTNNFTANVEEVEN